jgi:hypothetical protein
VKLAPAILLAASVTACSAAERQYVRPWFRTTTEPRHVLAPHAIEWGGGRRAEVLVGGSWRGLPHESFGVHPVGDAIAVDEFAFVDPHRTDPMNDERAHGASGVFIYREGHADAIHVPADQCATPFYSEDAAEIACFGCGTRAPLTALHRRDAPCGTMHVDIHDTAGRITSGLAFPSPIAEPHLEGRLPNGAWILHEDKSSADFLYVYGPPMRFSLDASGFHALPFGADPLHVDRDAEARAQEILRQVPLRDAAMASMRAAFADDERAHPSWIVRSEVANHLRPNQALEPTAPAQPGTCYTLVARASEGLTRLEVSIHGRSPYVPSSIEEVREGVLAFATGAPVATARRCHAPGDPAVYHYRVGSRGGAGYVLARVYAHPPESPTEAGRTHP